MVAAGRPWRRRRVGGGGGGGGTAAAAAAPATLLLRPRCGCPCRSAGAGRTEGSLGRRRVRVHARVLLCDRRWPEPKSQPRALLKLRKAETALLLSLTYLIRPVDVHDLGVEESRQRSLVSVLSRLAQVRLHLRGRRLLLLAAALLFSLLLAAALLFSMWLLS